MYATVAKRQVYARRYSKSHRELMRKREIQQKYKVKSQVFKKLGGRCQRCGIDDIRVLQVDHVNGSGIQDRKKGNGYSYYRRIRDDISGKYQLLCANCNWIKRWENSEHGKRTVIQ